MTPFRIGTRGSKLALWQAQHVADLLRPLISPRSIELVIISTTGDRNTHQSLSVIGGQGVFTKELQQALLDDRADVAVHSLKDLPTESVVGLDLAAVPERGPTGDAFVSHCHRRFAELPRGARLATSSSRRRAQLLFQRPDLELLDMRGNVDTRLRKLDEENLDGIILAEAGLVRLGMQDHIKEVLDSAWMLPAVGQGALGLECRTADSLTGAGVQRLNHEPTFHAVRAERAFLRTLGGGCQLPIAALAVTMDDTLTLRGAVLSRDGRQRLCDIRTGSSQNADAIGIALAQHLLSEGAMELLA